MIAKIINVIAIENKITPNILNKVFILLNFKG